MILYMIKMPNGEIIFTTNDKQLADKIVKNHIGSYIVEERMEDDGDED